jgi:hypothetical protein
MLHRDQAVSAEQQAAEFLRTIVYKTLFLPICRGSGRQGESSSQRLQYQNRQEPIKAHINEWFQRSGFHFARASG